MNYEYPWKLVQNPSYLFVLASVRTCATCVLRHCAWTGSQLFSCLNHWACCLDVLSVLLSALWNKVQNIKEITHDILGARIVIAPKGKRGWWIICLKNTQKKTLATPNQTLWLCTRKGHSSEFCFLGLLVILRGEVSPSWKEALDTGAGDAWSRLFFWALPWAKCWGN